MTRHIESKEQSAESPTEVSKGFLQKWTEKLEEHPAIVCTATALGGSTILTGAFALSEGRLSHVDVEAGIVGALLAIGFQYVFLKTYRRNEREINVRQDQFSDSQSPPNTREIK